jgi:hypothetical protein
VHFEDEGEAEEFNARQEPFMVALARKRQKQKAAKISRLRALVPRRRNWKDENGPHDSNNGLKCDEGELNAQRWAEVSVAAAP